MILNHSLLTAWRERPQDYVLITISTTRFANLRREWSQENSNEKRGLFIKVERRFWPRDGMVLAVHWESKKIVWAYPAQNPYQVMMNLPHIHIICDRFIETLDLRSGTRIYTTSSLFNNLHGACWNGENRFLVCSSGIDSVLDVSVSGNVAIIWSAYLDGLDCAPSGITRSLIVAPSYGYDNAHIDTQHHTTHVNSVAWTSLGLLISLFHQGQVRKIYNGTSEVVYEGLRRPHDVQPSGDGCLFSDTENAQVIYSEGSTNKVVASVDDCDWLQSFSINSKEHVLLGDASNCRVVEALKGEVISFFSLNMQWKVANVRWMDCTFPT